MIDIKEHYQEQSINECKWIDCKWSVNEELVEELHQPVIKNLKEEDFLRNLTIMSGL